MMTQKELNEKLRVAVPVLVTVIVACIILIIVEERKPPIETAIQFDFPGLSINQKNEITKAVTDWGGKYGPPNVILVKSFTPTNIIGGGPGFIEVDINSRESLRDQVLRKMTHSTKPVQRTKPSQRLAIPEGEIVGFQGLTLIIEKDGKEQEFELFQEGMADRNAAAFPEYKQSSSGMNIMEFTIKIFPNDGEQFVRKSDIPGFVGRVLGLPPESITGQLIWHAMQKYTAASQGRSTP